VLSRTFLVKQLHNMVFDYCEKVFCEECIDFVV